VGVQEVESPAVEAIDHAVVAEVATEEETTAVMERRLLLTTTLLQVFAISTAKGPSGEIALPTTSKHLIAMMFRWLLKARNIDYMESTATSLAQAQT
jgi:hypothetical protein